MPRIRYERSYSKAIPFRPRKFAPGVQIYKVSRMLPDHPIGGRSPSARFAAREHAAQFGKQRYQPPAARLDLSAIGVDLGLTGGKRDGGKREASPFPVQILHDRVYLQE